MKWSPVVTDIAVVAGQLKFLNSFYFTVMSNIWSISHMYKYNKASSGNTYTKAKEKHLIQHYMYIAHFQIPFLSSNKHTEKKYYKPEVDPNRFFNMWTAILRKTQQQHPSSAFMNCFSILSRLMRSPYLQALPIPVSACLTRQTNYTISSSNHILCLKSGICSAEQKMSSSRALWWVLKNSLNGFTSVICTCGKVVFLVNLINMI